jgi:MFS transporter, YNFM family, putative membrane transport protein
MTIDLRPLAVALGGFCSFLNLYAPQALLPELAREFGVGAADISAVMTVGTFAIALSAPFCGAVADVLGRKWVITVSMAIASIPTALVAFAPDVETIIAYRFVQGLLLPSIFTVVLAYVGDEWPPKDAARLAGVYVMGASVGGFSGRLIPGIVADIAGWRTGFAVLAVITLVATIVVAVTLPREKNFVRTDGLRASARQMLRHLRNPQLIATFAVGFGVLFNFIATFTYIGFRLAAPPYSLSNTALGALFTTYLVGSFLSPLVGRGIAAFGRRGFMLIVIVCWIGGILMLLASPLPVIVAGLVVCAACGLLAQSVSTGYVTTTISEGRSSAVGLYFTSFNLGGSLGAFLPGLTWNQWGWPMVVAEVMVMLAIMASIVAAIWPAAQPRP